MSPFEVLRSTLSTAGPLQPSGGLLQPTTVQTN